MKTRIFVRTSVLMVMLGLLWLFVWRWPLHHISDIPTFRMVAFIGLIQTLVVVFSAVIAIDSLPPNEKERKGRMYKVAFFVFGLLLFVCTYIVGYYNDKSQSEAKHTAGELATTLLEVRNCQKDPQCSKAGIIELIDKGFATLPRQYVARAAVQVMTTPLPTPIPAVKEDSSGPFSSLTDEDLAAKAKDFSIQLHRTNHTLYYPYSENYDYAKRRLLNLDYKTNSPDVVVSGFLAEDQIYHAFMNKVLQEDIPLAYAYRKELLKRLGARAKVVAEFPKVVATESSLNAFLMISWGALENWAQQLAQSH
jgi:hypothetical protein